ncbi:hypothetical protein TNCV_467011 [Trichonephila clavipes]|nr:hypothetical protein TNCV_467011 [Trichonephila clavipes]
MAAIDFLHHENPPTWAGVEPATLSAEGCQGLKYPKVMAYYYGTTVHYVINYSSLDWKTLRDFLGLVRSAAWATLFGNRRR